MECFTAVVQTMDDFVSWRHLAIPRDVFGGPGWQPDQVDS